MKSLEEHLVQYALYHRDKRNIRTHLVGVPLIVFAVIMLTYIPLFEFSQFEVTLSVILIGAVGAYYFYLSAWLGLIMIAILATGYALTTVLSSQIMLFGVPMSGFYAIGVGIFLFGWVVQFIGHHFEGKKPAFVDDLMGLLIGPLFVLVEVLFKFGCMKHLEMKILAQAGAYRN
ncbi:DUF962 domain-containing protein [Pseudoalteromonas luteoviolacea]|uniref:Putative membrane protein n=1 Tax=Pseudoalteromonas luteoviolacea (strain 2ta16) TaxID=1353533 RepID=V4HKU5_PSEL2|nr:Mpo1-like protein [Pseudoalteromonas luteoviolacea]ESP90368.1 putative membrane protein [Pseudoalteromonas luteoviolacea 2ta16]KZN40530.1 hypothetical protein N483_17370 [Pseudoalteromonas luteoviolacea NCIMB 1944]